MVAGAYGFASDGLRSSISWPICLLIPEKGILLIAFVTTTIMSQEIVAGLPEVNKPEIVALDGVKHVVHEVIFTATKQPFKERMVTGDVKFAKMPSVSSGEQKESNGSHQI